MLFKKKEKYKLAENEDQFRSAFEYSAIGMALVNLAGKLIKVNSSLCKIIGYPEMLLLTHTFQDITHPDDLQTDLHLLQELAAGERDTYQMEKRYIHANGHIVWALLAVSMIRDDSGKITHFIHQIQDISALKEKTDQLIKSENQLRWAFEYSAVGMALVDPDGKFIKVNNSLCEIIGCPENNLLNSSLQAITYPADLKTDYFLLKELTDGKSQSYQIEKRYIHQDGHTVWALLSVSLVRNDHGKIIHFIQQIQDISALKEKTDQLIKSENQLSLAFEYSAIGMALVDKSGRLIKVNNSLCKIIGYGQTDLLTHTFQDITHPDDLEKDLSLLQELNDGKRETYQMEKRYIREDGTIVWALLAVSMVKDKNGKIMHFIKQIQDITIIKENENKLNSLNASINKSNNELISKNEELKQFAYIASHDLQEPLRMVTGFLSKIEKKYEALLDDKGKMYIHFAVDGATRMRLLITGILNYSTLDNLDNLEKTQVDVDLLVKDIFASCELIPDKQKAEVHLAVLPVISANQTAMLQLFSNLINNAIKYQPPGNKPIIKISAEEKTGYWLFSIADNGIGIDARGLTKMFNIFQRLHTQNKFSGTGIGLAICKKIVTGMGGQIWAESEEGNGTTFFFTIFKPVI